MALVNIRTITQLVKDSLTSGLVSIDMDHARVHAAQMFQFWIAKSSLANSSVYKAYFTTPATGYLHWKSLNGWVSSAHLKVELREGMTATATGGKAVTVFNLKRTSSETAGITVKESATVTSGTSVIVDRTDIGGGGSSVLTRVGGQFGTSDEMILKQSTKYALFCTNLSGDSATFSLKYKFYLGGA